MGHNWQDLRNRTCLLHRSTRLIAASFFQSDSHVKLVWTQLSFACCSKEMGGKSKRKSPRWLDGPHGVGAKCELWQQSIVKSTSLVATTEGLDGNTRFSSQLRNQLIYNRLSNKGKNRNFLLNLLCCKTCLTESRYMVFRASKVRIFYKWLRMR